LPKPDAWFGRYFQKDQVPQLLGDNEAEVNNYRTVLGRMMNLVAKSQSFSVRVIVHRPGPSSTSGLMPRADAVLPSTPVPIQAYEIKFVAQNGKTFSELSNFVYVDGAYRYVAGGAYPFWSMPDASQKK
jgi:hypothetical protein